MVLSNLIYKPLDGSYLVNKALTYNSISPQNRFQDSFNDKKILVDKFAV